MLIWNLKWEVASETHCVLDLDVEEERCVVEVYCEDIQLDWYSPLNTHHFDWHPNRTQHSCVCLHFFFYFYLILLWRLLTFPGKMSIDAFCVWTNHFACSHRSADEGFMAHCSRLFFNAACCKGVLNSLADVNQFVCFHPHLFSPPPPRKSFILSGKALSPAKTTSYSGNPWASVLMSWFLVQVSGDM